MQLKTRAFNEVESNGLKESRQIYRASLAVDDDTLATQLLDKVDAVFSIFRAELGRLSSDEVTDRIFVLGMAWGDATSSILGWQWATLYRENQETPCILNPDNTLAVPVFDMLRRLLGEPTRTPGDVYVSLLNGYYVGEPGSLKVVT